MHQNKTNSFVRHQLMLAATILLACAVMLVGATWARYRANEVGYLGYAIKGNEPIYLQTSGGWAFAEDSGELSFSVSNSEDGISYAENSKTISVRLLASLAIAEIEDVNVYLTVSDEFGDTVYTAVPVPIAEGTVLYKTFGPGRVYQFQDTDAKELKWILEGGTVSTMSAQLTIEGLGKPKNPALLQLQVVGG